MSAELAALDPDAAAAPPPSERDVEEHAPALPQPRRWMQWAACRHADVELFFPERGGSPDAAKHVCARCPVQRQCRDYALADGTLRGVWGGLSFRERRDIRADREKQGEGDATDEVAAG